MIISETDIRNIRPVSGNLNAKDRLEPYIREVEKLYLIPTLSPKLYKMIDENPEKYEILLNGGYYNDDECYFAGIKEAAAYLVYSRFLYNQSIVVTPFGVVNKDNELSDQAAREEITYQANQAKELGIQYLKEVIKYCTFAQLIKSPAKGEAVVESKRKFRVVDGAPVSGGTSTIITSTGGTGKEYFAGEGLKLDGVTFSVDFNKVASEVNLEDIKDSIDTLDDKIETVSGEAKQALTDVTTVDGKVSGLSLNLLSINNEIRDLHNEVDNIKEALEEVLYGNS